MPLRTAGSTITTAEGTRSACSFTRLVPISPGQRDKKDTMAGDEHGFSVSVKSKYDVLLRKLLSRVVFRA
jgi:hypothetical protein